MKFVYGLFCVLLLFSISYGQNVSVGDPAPAFMLDRFNGGTLSLGDYEGKVRFLNFFGSYCPICQTEAQKIEDNIWQRFKDRNFQAIGLDIWDGNPGQVDDYANEGNRNVTYPLAMNAGSVSAQEYGITSQSSYIIIDQEGIVQYISPLSTPYTQRYGRHEDEMIAKIEELLGMPTSVKNQKSLPEAFKLYQNSPNPFRLSTNIRIDVLQGTATQATTLTIYDILGRKVNTIYSGNLSPGNHSFNWQGVDYNGNQVAKGVYFYVLENGALRETKKLIYLSK